LKRDQQEGVVHPDQIDPKKQGGISKILLLHVYDMLIVGKKKKIAELKKALRKSFAMKDSGGVEKTLRIKIINYHSKRMLWTSQEYYVKQFLKRFKMHDDKHVHVPLSSHLKLSKTQCSKNDQEKEEMGRVTYSPIMGSLMYIVVCTRPDIAYIVGVEYIPI
jgi:hypothetical protein